MSSASPHPVAIGVDGAGSGWLAVWRTGSALTYQRYESALALWAANAKAQVIAVDIPIGLADRDPRPTDRAARAYVGGKRASSVYSAPIRAVLHLPTRREASDAQRAVDGRGLSAQAFALFPKIREWDALLQSDARARAVIRETHPEVCFAALNGGLGKGLIAGKRKEAGHQLRIELLQPIVGPSALKHLLQTIPKRMAAPDDILDAVVALHTAERLLQGQAQALPDPSHCDAAGLPMAIWY